MRIGIIGGRLAGSYASLLLSGIGHEVLLLDNAPEREKPCGGGVTSKALRNVAWFQQHPLPHTEIRTLRMTTLEGDSADLALKNPIHIFSRATLDSALREAAIKAGTRFVPLRALGFIPHNGGWAIRAPGQEYEVDLLVGADGATSSVRAAVSSKFLARDLSLALGFYLPGLYHQNVAVALFLEKGFPGYLWSFPRIDHSSVGILQWLPVARASDLRRRVAEFISERYPEAGSDMRFYAARIPCLSRETLINQRVCGKNWALLGDAAGFADAITAEGIYFALRSAELLAEALQRRNVQHYETAWRRDFGADLLRAAEWRDNFYGGRFLFQPFIRRAIQLTRYSQTVQVLTDALICGRRDYAGLRRHLILRSPLILLEAFRRKGQLTTDH